MANDGSLRRPAKELQSASEYNLWKITIENEFLSNDIQKEIFEGGVVLK